MVPGVDGWEDMVSGGYETVVEESLVEWRALGQPDWLDWYVMSTERELFWQALLTSHVVSTQLDPAHPLRQRYPQSIHLHQVLEELGQESNPGFVWRFQTDEGHAAAIRHYDDDRFLINLSVSESIAAFRILHCASPAASLRSPRDAWLENLRTRSRRLARRVVLAQCV